MREIDCQSMVVDLVRSRGGAAHKMSNRFLVGVADLSVKLPLHPAVFVEVKLEQTRLMNFREFKLDVTPLQKKFLREYRDAGMCCGVLSFVEAAGLGKRGLHAVSFRLDSIEAAGYRVRLDHHLSLCNPDTRDDQLITLLEEICLTRTKVTT